MLMLCCMSITTTTPPLHDLPAGLLATNGNNDSPQYSGQCVVVTMNLGGGQRSNGLRESFMRIWCKPQSFVRLLKVSSGLKRPDQQHLRNKTAGVQNAGMMLPRWRAGN